MGRQRPVYINMRLSKRLSVYVFCVTFGLLFWWLADNSSSPRTPHLSERSARQSGTSTDFEAKLGQPVIERIVDKVLKGESLSQTLSRNGLSQPESILLIDSLQKEVNLKQIRPGDAIVIERKATGAQGAGSASPELEAFELVRNEQSGLSIRYRIQRTGDNLEAGSFELTKLSPQVTTRQETVTGSIGSSLYDGILLAGGDPALVNRFSDFFGWQIDFYRETQRGDSFKMVVEAKYVDGRFIGYGKLSAAEYATSNRTFRGFAYESADGQSSGIYGADGVSFEKSFLKSPLELARITSRFGQRFHPILRKQKSHNGVDYGASTGTPFWSVADGVVMEARYSPSAGNMIRIKHRNGYITEYFHASKIAAGIRAGAHVKQRQIIGYVGTTGRSTGPHLHFGMTLASNYVDPSKQNFPTGNTLPPKEKERFLRTIAPLIAELSRPAPPQATASR